MQYFCFHPLGQGLVVDHTELQIRQRDVTFALGRHDPGKMLPLGRWETVSVTWQSSWSPTSLVQLSSTQIPEHLDKTHFLVNGM